MANRHIDPLMLSSYIDGELKDRNKNTVEEHLEGCADCRAQLQELQGIGARLPSWQAPVPSWDFDDRVRHRIIASDAEGGRVKMKKPMWVLIPSGVVAGILVLIMVSGVLNRGLQGRLREATVADHFAVVGEQFDPGTHDPQSRGWGGKAAMIDADGTASVDATESYYGQDAVLRAVSLERKKRSLDLEKIKYAGKMNGKDSYRHTRDRSGRMSRTEALQLGGGVVRESVAQFGTPQQSWGDDKDAFFGDEKAGEAPGGSVIIIAPTLIATGEGEQIIRTANVAIEVENGQDAYTLLSEVCAEAGGYLAASTLNADEDGRIAGYVTMRIPQAKFLEVLDKVRTLGDVKQFVTDSRDVARVHRNLKERLDAAMVVYKKMLKALQNRKNTVEDALRTESELTPVLGRIQGLKDQLEALENAVSYTTITVAFGEPEVSERLVAASGKHIQRAMMAAKIGFIKSFAKALPNLGGILVTILIVFGAGLFIAHLISKKTKVE